MNALVSRRRALAALAAAWSCATVTAHAQATDFPTKPVTLYTAFAVGSGPDAVLRLDEALAEHNAALPRLQEFILPAGTRSAALAHVCRTVARRAERAVVALERSEALKDTPRQYLNRLSDLMFVLARVLNRMNGGDDVYWKSARMNQGTDAK